MVRNDVEVATPPGIATHEAPPSGRWKSALKVWVLSLTLMVSAPKNSAAGPIATQG